MENVTRRSFVQGASLAGMAAAAMPAVARADEAAPAAAAAETAVFADEAAAPSPTPATPPR